MEKIDSVPSGQRAIGVDLLNQNQLAQVVLQTKQNSYRHLLLRHPNFVAKSKNLRREAKPLACEASVLTAELTAPNHAYFSPKYQLCKYRPAVLSSLIS